MSYESLLAESERLSRVMDRVIDAHDGPSPAIPHADWACYRFATVLALVRSQSGGTTAPALARGLLEEAALWDWAIATNAEKRWLDRLTLNEFERLRKRADPADDIWLQWVLPPGRRVEGGPDGVPNGSDAVKRLGQGFTAARLAPLSMTGLFAVYKLIEVVTHGSCATALLFATDDGCQMSEPLASSVLHVAGAGAAAIIASHLDLTTDESAELATSALAVARTASEVHGIALGAVNTRRVAKSVPAASGVIESTIVRMPPPGPAIHVAAADYVDAASAVIASFRSLGPQEADPMGYLAAATIDLAGSHLMTLQGVLDGGVGRACLPVAARALFEDGARWGWLRHSIGLSQDGNSIKAMLGEAQRYMAAAESWMQNEGIPGSVINRLLSGSELIRQASFDGLTLPHIEDMIQIAYPTAEGGTAWALPMYGILSQFVHYSPIATLHLQRDVFTSISAPAFAVAVDAACSGHFLTILGASAIAFGDRRECAAPALQDLADALRSVRSVASGSHFLD